MLNLDHPQLDPHLNRSRRVPGSAASVTRLPNPDLFQPDVDPKDPYKPTHTGLFDGSIVDEKGVRRCYTVYVPTTMKTSGSMALVFIDSGKKARDFIAANNWIEVLEERETSAFFFEAPNGWDRENPGVELDAATKMLAEMRWMELFAANAPSIYALGFGDGAYPAAVFAMTHCSVIAGWAACGDCRVDPKLIEYIGASPSDCDEFVPKKLVKLPTFILDGKDEDHPLVSYFRTACACRDEKLWNEYGRVYRQAPKPGEFYLNDPVIVEVWQGDPDKAKEMGMDKVIAAMVNFVTSYRRWAGEGNAYIRRAETPKSMGFKEYRKEIDGLVRLWHVFEPTAYHNKLKEKYPLVVAIHGFSCSGPFFAENSGWQMVAEERGFFCVFPTAYPRKREGGRGLFGGNIARTPNWNSAIEKDAGEPDEVSFFKQMIEDLEARYPIDPERIYVSGHSNGSAMTQRLMRYMPGMFAGFNPVGGVEGSMDGAAVPEPDDVVRPVWYILGEFDRAGMYLTGHTADVFESLCKTNGCSFENRSFYESGIHNITVAKNAKGEPLVKFTGLRNYPHTFSPDVSLMVWDDFFAKLRRKADGSIEYLG
ncbi:MAG: hypothetical protein IIZ49_04030 [Oscillospiraceae bacterium]|nr:hypothetical protein [Oscillospiraceae bacterium]